MDTGRSISLTSSRQVNDRLFNHSVHLSSTINGTTFKLMKAGTTTVIGAVVSYDPTTKKAILNPNANLQLGTRYQAVVTTGAQDLAGNRLDQNTSLSGLQQKAWTFTIRN